MIRTYYIKGYVVEEPYLDSKMKARCYSDKTLYESLSRIVKLILVSENGTIIFKSVAKIKQGKLFHKYSITQTCSSYFQKLISQFSLL